MTAYTRRDRAFTRSLPSIDHVGERNDKEADRFEMRYCGCEIMER